VNPRGWFERLLDSVADHSLELIGLKHRDGRVASDSELCQRLIEGQGEASNIAIAREILQRWRDMNDAQRLTFLNMIAVELDPDPEEIREAANAYKPKNPASLARLMQVTEPPRQELFRRLNMAPDGTATLVGMREFLVESLKSHPGLRSVDYDLLHLLGSWFNRGFLRLERIDWNSPASVLEKLIRYEAVHPMQGWDDLRRRLASDRRCFAFFHPALPQDPLIFVEVALTGGISDAIAPLIDIKRPEDDPNRANTAVFYSINNALKGLRGVSFGNFLIKQVVTELVSEFPSINQFVTLSPIPRMRDSLSEMMKHDVGGRGRGDLFNALGDRLKALEKASGLKGPIEALDELLWNAQNDKHQALIKDAMTVLTLFYLTSLKRDGLAYDPVAHFHLSNGARLERINVLANRSERGLLESWSCMVNYRYEGDHVVSNHEAYVTQGQIALSPELSKLAERLPK
jgi:malonyl-CoA decarboxylase